MLMGSASGDDWSGAVNSMRLVPAVLADAIRVYARHVTLIVPIAVVVFGATGLAFHALNDLLEQPVDAIGAGTVWAGIAVIALVAPLSVFAEVLFAGLLDNVVDAQLAGRPTPSLAAVARRIPYLRLVLADALVVGLGIAGLFLLVLPGLAAFTLLGLAGPLVIAEDRGPWAATRRSFELLRGRLGAAVLLVLVPGIVAISIEDRLTEIVQHWSTIPRVVAEVGFDATVAAYAGLLLAVLARRLVSAAGSSAGPA